MAFIAGLGILLSVPAFSQGFTPPAEGNAAVYFVRVSNYGGSTSFEFFHGDQFIGIFKKKNYMRYECPAGPALLWASSENKEFLDCDLKAGETYLVLINIYPGGFKARVGLAPVTAEHEDFERMKALVLDKKPVVTDEEVIQSTQKKLEERGFIEEILQRYETDWKNKPATEVISQDMFIPRELLE